MKQQVVEKDYSSLSYDELSSLSRNDHQEDVKQYDKQQNALCLIMIGGLCLICGILFFILSFARAKNQSAGLDVTQLQFIVSVACFVAALTLLILGFIRFFKAHKIRKQLKEEITKVSSLKKEMMINSK